MVVSDQCVLCGHCVRICPAGAKRVRDDLSRAKQLLSLRERVIVSIAPSFSSEFAGVPAGSLVSAIRRLGFFGVSETAIGADLVSATLAADFAAAGASAGGARSGGASAGSASVAGASVAGASAKLYLSSACPVAVEYVKRYMGEFAPYITDRASPLLAHARFLRERYGQDIGVVFVGPCVAKKREADVWKAVDCAISFGDLRKWLEEEGLSLDGPARESPEAARAVAGSASSVPGVAAPGFVPFRAAKGSLYPVDGGMIAAIKKYPGSEGTHMMSVCGIDGIDDAIRGLDPESLEAPLFIELLACPGGCVNGPLGSVTGSTALRRIKALEYAETARDTLKADRPDMAGTLPVTRSIPVVHGEDEIRAALRQVGKIDASDELNCGSCGYDTCRTFAAAMLDHHAERTMCVSYMRKLAQKKANGLIRAIPSGVVICDAALSIIECNENFARLMGSDILSMFEAKPGMEGADLGKITGLSRFFRDVMATDGPDVVEHELREGKKILHATVFSIEKGEIACGVIQDVTAPQIQRDRVIKQTKRVIDKNLAVVQKIAFLLGENAADTETSLNSIIESFSEIGEDEE